MNYFGCRKVKTKSSKSANAFPAFVTDVVNSADTTEAIAELFNNFFTNIKSDSISNESESEISITEMFNDLKKNKLINTPQGNFSFNKVTLEQVVKTLGKISAESSPGYSGIPCKILLNSLKIIAPFLVEYLITRSARSSCEAVLLSLYKANNKFWT